MIELEVKSLGRHLVLPPIKTIFPMKRNPLQEDRRLNEMVDHLFEYSLMTEENYKKTREMTLFTAHFHPFCNEINKYVNLGRLMQLLGIFDDHTECLWGDIARKTDRSDEIWGQLYQCLDKVLEKNKVVSAANWKPYVFAQYIAFQEIYQDLDYVQMRRLTQTYREWGEGNQKECQLIEKKNEIMSLESYLEVRLKSGACKCVFAMIEYADGLYLTDEEWSDPLTQRFLELGTILIILNNDVISYEKELLEKKDPSQLLFNSVAIHMTLKGCSDEEAMLEIIKLYHEYEKETEDIMNQILNGKDMSKDLKTFIENSGYIIGGNVAC